MCCRYIFLSLVLQEAAGSRQGRSAEYPGPAEWIWLSQETKSDSCKVTGRHPPGWVGEQEGPNSRGCKGVQSIAGGQVQERQDSSQPLSRPASQPRNLRQPSLNHPNLNLLLFPHIITFGSLQEMFWNAVSCRLDVIPTITLLLFCAATCVRGFLVGEVSLMRL